MDFFSLAQNIYRLDYRDMVQKLHCPIHVRSMGIEMGLEWAKEKEQTGNSLAKAPHQGTFTAEEYWACAYPHVFRGYFSCPQPHGSLAAPTKWVFCFDSVFSGT